MGLELDRAFGIVAINSGAHTVLALTGELDQLACSELTRAVLAVVDEADTLIVDLAGVSYIDGAGLSALLQAEVTAARCGCSLRIDRPQPFVERLLEIIGLDALLLI